MSRTTIICVGCPRGCRIEVTSEDEEITAINGYQCPVGLDYARKEFNNPTRVLPTTVRVKNGELPLVPVKTAEPIPRKILLQAVKKLADIKVTAPVKAGEIILTDILDTGIDVIATRSIRRNEDNRD